MKVWDKTYLPKRILVIRLQAMGDMVLALPYCQAIRAQFPSNVKIDFLTREEVADIPQNIELFDRVYVIKGGRNSKKQLFWLLTLLPGLMAKNYDVVLDMQNNKISRIARKMIGPGCWSEFDRSSPISAMQRYKNSILKSEIVSSLDPVMGFNLKHDFKTYDLLIKNGHIGKESLVLLNPAGAFVNRNWPLDKYIEFAELWLNKFPGTKFLLLGLETIREKSNYIKEKLGNNVIDLVGKTSPVEVLEILKKVDLTVSEDSGLLHMSYLSGVPSIGMLGSTRNDWTNPGLPHTYFFNSSDLPCGNCMLSICSRDDNYCMTRIDPHDVYSKAILLLDSIKSKSV